jgi:hypothetical protein
LSQFKDARVFRHISSFPISPLLLGRVPERVEGQGVRSIRENSHKIIKV